jgi:UDP-GlcNAc:undecaprenyl-phosphate/decaprenyl-phosphate GlcNAc-1-phosphate transferase
MLGTIIFLFTAALCALAVKLLQNSNLANRLLDDSSKAHAMHLQDVPRFGGLAILISAALIWLGWAAYSGEHLHSTLLLVFFLALVIMLVSLVDDMRGLSPLIRFAIQFLTAIVTIYFFQSAIQMWVTHYLTTQCVWFIGALIFILIAIVWFANLYNFMDGANGMAGMMGVVGFAAFAFMAQRNVYIEDVAFVVLSSAIAGACLGFLFFNFPRARLFMGDCGSVTLGYLAATLGLFGVTQHIWSAWFPLIVFSPFIVDSTITLLKRSIRREKIWQSHRQHYYQQLILILGWSHMRTAYAYCGLMLCAAISGISLELGLINIKTNSLLLMWVVIYVLLLTCLEWRFSVQNKKNSNKNNNV